jgi:hypothetical protein
MLEPARDALTLPDVNAHARWAVQPEAVKPRGIWRRREDEHRAERRRQPVSG